MPEATPAPAAAPAAATPAPAATTNAAATPAANPAPQAPAAAPPAPAAASSPAPAAAGEKAAPAPGVPKDGDLLGGEVKADEGKPEGEKKPDEPKAEVKPIDPASYKFEFPEGVKADEAILKPATELFAKNGFTNEQAQSLVNFWNDQTKNVSEQASKHIFDQWRTTQEQWQAEVKADARIGGDKLPATLKTINDGIRQGMGDHATKFFAALKFTGAANNPDVIRGFEMMLRRRTEGGPVTGNAPTTTAKSFASRLYGQKSQGE